MRVHSSTHIGSQLKLKSFFVSIITFCLFSFSLSFAQSVPPLINYQGRLTDANGVGLTGTKRLEFNVYDATTGGNIVWGIQIIDDVPLVDGHFNVILSTDNQGRSIADAFNSKNRYIAIKVGEPHTDLSGVSEISPRQQILSAPYAVQAESAWFGVPAGTIIAFGGQSHSLPGGWLHCAGAAVSSEDYPALYAAIGTSWGNGSNDSNSLTDFNLPDLIGRFLRGRDYQWNRDPDWSSRTASQTGGNTGDAVGSVQGDATKRPNNAFTTDSQGDHHHHLHDWQYEQRGQSSGNYGVLQNYYNDKTVTSDAGAHTHTITGGGDSETRPKNAYVNWFIKY